MSSIQLLVGLGNPGVEYQSTRHNMGADWIAQLANCYQVSLKPNSRFHGLYGSFSLDDRFSISSHFHLLIPTTFMNHSGRAVHAIARFYKIPTSNILVIHDELDLPLGQARFKQGGGSGGHNGLKDIMASCGQDFWRLRLGIGHPKERAQVIDYVLKRPLPEEHIKLQKMFEDSLSIFPDFMVGNIQAAMHQLHSIVV